MEEILSSIKRIIAEDGEPGARTPRQTRRPRAIEPEPEPVIDDIQLDDFEDEEVAQADDFDDLDEILELTDEVEAPMPTAKATTTPRAANHAPATAQVLDENDSILSTASEAATRQALANLSNLVIRPQTIADDNTLEGLIRAMLKPMLKDWLDQNLPRIVQDMVAKEISRISRGN